MNEQDALREARIDIFRRKMIRAVTVEERLFFWKLMTAEIRRRSREKVAEMEKAAGIA
jgi:hypothetical protein